MQFVVIAYDGTDEEALSRRMAVREQHLALNDRMAADGKILYTVAILNDEEKMIGSVMVVNLPSRTAVDEWLKVEPYVTGDVWRTISVHRAFRREPQAVK